MRVVLGLDIGTTSLSAVAYDCVSRRVVAQITLPNKGALYEDLPGGLLAAELDLGTLRRQLGDLLVAIAAALPAPDQVVAIGVTGQQHGMALLDGRLDPVGNAITWQDQRTELLSGDGVHTWLEELVARAGGPAAFERTGCHPAAGFMGPSLYRVLQQGRAQSAAHVCMIPDAAVSMLTGLAPTTDPTDAGSSGFYDLVSSDWAWNVIDRLGIPRVLFPPVSHAGTPHGTLIAELAAQAHLPRVPVCVAAGDNQASYVGTVRDPAHTVLVNVGTGGQVSTVSPVYVRVPGIETRAYFGDAYLLVGAGLYGGRAYAYLQSFFQQVGATLYGQDAEAELYERMNALAVSVPPGCDGLVCSPLFTGTREEPEIRASFSGIGPTNFSPGHMARALLEGVAEGFWELYSATLPQAGARSVLVGAGNGLTHNPQLSSIVASRFGMDLHLAEGVEAAALGAALLAADGTGELPLAEGSAGISYDRVIPASSG